MSAHRIAAVLLAAAVPAAARTAPDDPEKLRCGEYCLRVALPGLGFDDAATAAAVETLGVPPAGGHAPADLADAVRAAGGRWLAVQTTADALRRRRALGERFACVAHVDGSHYVLLSEIGENGEARVIDPPASYPLPPETLARRWDGAALLVSRDPLTPEADLPGPFPWAWALLAAAGLFGAAGVWLWRREPGGRAVKRFTGPVSAAGAVLSAAAAGCGGPGDGPAAGVVGAAAGPPRAVWETYRRDAGVIPVSPAGHVLEFPVTNRGGSPLRFLGVTTSCGCTDAVAPAHPLGPGETAAVRLSFAPKLPETRTATAVVATDDPDAPHATLTVSWRSVAPWTPEPAELDFGDLRPGETAERTVRLVRHTVAGGDGPLAGGTAAGLSVPPGPLAAEWETPPDADEPPAARVRLTAPAKFGPGGGVLTVGLTDAWVPHLAVPVRWTVRDVAAVEPAQAFLGSGPPGAAGHARVLLVATAPLEVDGEPAVTGEGFAGVAATVTRLSPTHMALDLRGPLPDAAGIHEGAVTVAVTVEAADGPQRRTLTVPVSALVAAPADGGAS